MKWLNHAGHRNFESRQPRLTLSVRACCDSSTAANEFCWLVNDSKAFGPQVVTDFRRRTKQVRTDSRQHEPTPMASRPNQYPNRAAPAPKRVR